MIKKISALTFVLASMSALTGEAQAQKVWKHGMVEAKSDAGFVFMAEKGGFAAKNGIKIENVGLVAIARDGNETDIKEILEPYNEAIALNAIAKYNKTLALTEAPAPEKDASFCASYCPYFGACPGIVDKSKENPIENDEIQLLVKNYKDLSGEAKDIKAKLDFIKDQLVGTNGYTSDGTTVSWTQVSGRETIDEAEVQKLLGFVPKKRGSGYPKLTVK